MVHILHTPGHHFSQQKPLQSVHTARTDDHGYISISSGVDKKHPSTSCPDVYTDLSEPWQAVRTTEDGAELKLGRLTVIVLLPRHVNYAIGKSGVDISWACMV